MHAQSIGACVELGQHAFEVRRSTDARLRQALGQLGGNVRTPCAFVGGLELAMRLPEPQPVPLRNAQALFKFRLTPLLENGNELPVDAVQAGVGGPVACGSARNQICARLRRFAIRRAVCGEHGGRQR